MNEQEIIETLESLELSPDKIDEFVLAMKTKEAKTEVFMKKNDVTLEDKLKNETDWRVRASLAAQIISRNLE